jgi:hypothetical protein
MKLNSKNRKKDEDGSWRKLHSDELHNLYSSPNIVMVVKSKRMRTCGTHEGGAMYLQGFASEAQGKRSLGRTRLRWEGKIKMDLREIEIDGANWIQPAQDRVQWRTFVSTIMNLRVP